MFIIQKNKNYRLWFIFSLIAMLLLIPFVAMFFTAEVNWTMSDFMVATILLVATGVGIEIILKKITSSKWRLILVLVVLLILFLVWLELAVGIFS